MNTEIGGEELREGGHAGLLHRGIVGVLAWEDRLEEDSSGQCESLEVRVLELASGEDP